MKKLELWYENMNKYQKIFVYLLTIPLTFVLIGPFILALLIYLELGKRFS